MSDTGAFVECPSCEKLLSLDLVMITATAAAPTRFVFACDCGLFVPVTIRVAQARPQPPKWAKRLPWES